MADKSLCADGLHPRDLKEVACEIIDALVLTFQHSIDLGKAVLDWKISNVASLFKNIYSRNNRAVSLTCQWVILEVIIKDRALGKDCYIRSE